MKGIIRTAAVVLMLGYASVSSAQLSFYVVEDQWATELDFGGPDAEAHDINDLNEIVGWVNDAANNDAELPRAVFYKNGTVTWITDQYGYYNTHALGINNSSRVVGTYQDPYEQPATPHAFWWNSTSDWFKELSTQSYFSEANAINDAGLIAGSVKGNIGCNGQDDLPVTWKIVSGWPGIDFHIHFCPPAATSTLRIRDINESGAVTGWKENGPGAGARAFRWNGSLVTAPLPAGAYETFGEGINESGAVAGTVNFFPESGTPARAFFWSGSSATSVVLGTLPGGGYSHGKEVNDQQFVTGYSEHEFPLGGGVGKITRLRAFIWHPHFGMKALPIPQGFSMHGTDCYANALNNVNWFAGGYIRVVGYCTNSQDQKRPVRWTVKVDKVSIPPLDL
jgi:hypothetical protein